MTEGFEIGCCLGGEFIPWHRLQLGTVRTASGYRMELSASTRGGDKVLLEREGQTPAEAALWLAGALAEQNEVSLKRFTGYRESSRRPENYGLTEVEVSCTYQFGAREVCRSATGLGRNGAEALFAAFCVGMSA